MVPARLKQARRVYRATWCCQCEVKCSFSVLV
jgi:hypothetical protein